MYCKCLLVKQKTVKYAHALHGSSRFGRSIGSATWMRRTWPLTADCDRSRWARRRMVRRRRRVARRAVARLVTSSRLPRVYLAAHCSGLVVSAESKRLLWSRIGGLGPRALLWPSKSCQGTLCLSAPRGWLSFGRDASGEDSVVHEVGLSMRLN
jgi:hypothetical protein